MKDFGRGALWGLFLICKTLEGGPLAEHLFPLELLFT